jgi:hypothetical protein
MRRFRSGLRSDLWQQRWGVLGAFVAWVIARRTSTPVAPTLTPAALPERPSLSVRRVIEPDDHDLPEAYEVYCKGITNPDERDSFMDIQRWLGEAKATRCSGTAKLDEYLLIATVGSKVCAFFYAQYYPSHRALLIGYLVLDPDSGDAKRASSLGVIEFMFKTLGLEHPECRGVVFELSLDPEKPARSRSRRRPAR